MGLMIFPTDGERRNGFTPETLEAYLRDVCPDPFEFWCEVFRRAEARADTVQTQIKDFLHYEDMTDQTAQKELLALEKEQAKAQKVCEQAAKQRDEILSE